MEKREVCIIGAGPAGTVAALFLARAGIRCTLIDKGRFPRHKICGDGISGWVVSVLKELDPSIIARLVGEDFVLPSHGMRVSAPNGKFVDIPFADDSGDQEKIPPGFVAPRVAFDHFLFSLAAAHPLIEVWEETAISGCVREEGEIRLIASDGEPKAKARMVLFANGHSGKIFPEAHRMKNAHEIIGIRGYFKDVTGFHEKNHIEIHFLKEILPGYLWLFPMTGGGANVGLGAARELIKRKKINLKRELEKALQMPRFSSRFRSTLTESPLQAGSIPIWKGRAAVSGNNYLLLGDAANLADPVTGEGIGHAVVSGKYAALQVGQALSAGRFDAEFLTAYDEKLYGVIGEELRISSKIRKVLKHPFLINTFIDKAQNNPYFRQVLEDALANLDDREKLKKPWFYVKMLFR